MFSDVSDDERVSFVISVEVDLQSPTRSLVGQMPFNGNEPPVILVTERPLVSVTRHREFRFTVSMLPPGESNEKIVPRAYVATRRVVPGLRQPIDGVQATKISTPFGLGLP